MNIQYECVNKLYVGRKVVIVLEFTPARGKVEKDQDPNLGIDLDTLESVVQPRSTFS